MNKAPSFQFYAQDFLTGVVYLTNEEIGIYIKMLCKQWTDGKIPKKRLGLLVGLDWVNFSDELKNKFVEHGDYLINTRLEQEREKKKTFLKRQAENGKKGGRPPKNDKKESDLKTQTKAKKSLYEEEDENEEEDEKENEHFGKSENLLKIEKLQEDFKNETSWKESICRNIRETKKGFSMQDVDDWLETFFNLITSDGEEFKTISDTKKHFNRWLLIEIKKQHGNSTSNQGRNNSNQGYKPAAIDSEKLVQQLTDDLENGDIPGQY